MAIHFSPRLIFVGVARNSVAVKVLLSGTLQHSSKLLDMAEVFVCDKPSSLLDKGMNTSGACSITLFTDVIRCCNKIEGLAPSLASSLV